MIQSIHIADVATFGPAAQVVDKISTFNFFYGSNGSGKTTISRVLAEAEAFPKCNIGWRGGTKLQTLVYNRHFVERNFSQSPILRGIFTLGEQNIEILKAIENARRDLDDLSTELRKKNYALQGEDGKGGKKAELIPLETELGDTCWAQKVKHEPKLRGAFEGVLGSKEKFKARVLRESKSNAAPLDTRSNLERRAETVFGATPTKEQLLPPIDAQMLIAHEANPILGKRVVGKADVDIAAMIKKLGNCDWVKAGRAYYETNDQACPFCQQTTSDRFAASLAEYFDETFLTDSKAVSDLEAAYLADSQRVQKELEVLLNSQSKFIDQDKLRAARAVLDTCFTINAQRLSSKKKEPSQSIGLDSHAEVLSTIGELIASANLLTNDHNKMVDNLAQERATLTSQVWKYLLEVELKGALTSYETKRSCLAKAIESIGQQIVGIQSDIGKKTEHIRTLEGQTTSVQPSIDGINGLLSAFGFQGFLLARGAADGSYQLKRPDGSDAKETLSEGERNFVTFLYFYYSLKGSYSATGTTADRVVVLDDPVSSLDGDVLFIVTSLIRGLFDEVRESKGYIRQVFVLTHNVYFHKEVTFNSKRTGDALSEETFWTIHKSGLESKLRRHPTNPIKTSYELLWSQVRSPDRANGMMQNTLRRILEYYFKILGGLDHYKACDKFEGKEKLVCRSLFSWTHDGSHYVDDDLYLSTDDTAVDTYLRVFRQIFYRLGHIEHFKMMMGTDYQDDRDAPEGG